MAKQILMVVLLATLLHTSSLVHANAQTYVTGGSPGRLVNIDEQTIRDRPPVQILRPFPVRQAWFTLVDTAPEEHWTKRIEQLISVSCELEKIAILKVVEYLPNDKMGDGLKQDDHTSSYEYVVPGSVGHRMMEALCSH